MQHVMRGPRSAVEHMCCAGLMCGATDQQIRGRDVHGVLRQGGKHASHGAGSGNSQHAQRNRAQPKGCVLSSFWPTSQREYFLSFKCC